MQGYVSLQVAHGLIARLRPPGANTRGLGRGGGVEEEAWGTKAA